ncbi:MAG: HigA family addiction module antidote protein [Alphaproteobacteria bacterium]|nr:HigA family addiction module antidote protein [Alphaproteobacteria bacterium]
MARRDIPLPHPGEILREEFLVPMGISVYALSKAIGVSRSRINEIVRGERALTPETALRLARYFGTSAELWTNLQTRYDLDTARATLVDALAAIAPRRKAA